jgi:hypothetical protein
MRPQVKEYTKENVKSIIHYLAERSTHDIHRYNPNPFLIVCERPSQEISLMSWVKRYSEKNFGKEVVKDIRSSIVTANAEDIRSSFNNLCKYYPFQEALIPNPELEDVVISLIKL